MLCLLLQLILLLNFKMLSKNMQLSIIQLIKENIGDQAAKKSNWL